MSTSALLYSIVLNLYKIGGPILLAIGTISCVLNLMVFTKNTLRKNPCTICFIAVNVINFFFLYWGFFISILSTGYNIDLNSKNIVYCRLNYYIGFLLSCGQASYLILASIDRTFVTSQNAAIRRRSTRRLIAISMISIGLFWILFHIHALIFTQILQYGPNYFVCYYQPGVYTTFVTYYSLVVSGILPPVLMLVFGYWSLKNRRQVRHTMALSGASNTAVTVIGRPVSLRSKDRQLARMLFIEIITYIILKFPVTIVYLYQQITKDDYKSVEQQLNEQYILQIVYFLYFIENCLSCYMNIMVSKTFRTELKRILLSAFH